jgi:hypothetical protein
LKCHFPIHFSFRFKSLSLWAKMTRLIFYHICYLPMKEDNLFVLCVCCIEIFQITSLITFLISLEVSQWVDFIMFWRTMQTLLRIEQIFAQNSFESKLKIIGKFGCTFDSLGKPLVSRIEWRWFFKDLRCLSNFYHWRFYQITKLVLEEKLDE